MGLRRRWGLRPSWNGERRLRGSRSRLLRAASSLPLSLALSLAAFALAAPRPAAASSLFAGVAYEVAREFGGTSEQPPGGLVSVDEAALGTPDVPSGDSFNPGGTTLVADAFDGPGDGFLMGLDFAPDGRLFASTCSASFCPEGPSELLEIDPTTGASTSIGFIREGDTQLSIQDLAFQPGTGTLFGVADFLGDTCFNCLYTIDLDTAEATLVADLALGGGGPGGIAFGPDGTLYLSTKFPLEGFGSRAPQSLLTIDPDTGGILSVEQVLLQQQFRFSGGGTTFLIDTATLQGLASRPDGTLVGTGAFGNTLMLERVFDQVLDPEGQPVGDPTYVWRVVGDTGENLGDLAFQPAAAPVPEPGVAVLLVMAGLGLGARRRSAGRGARPAREDAYA